MHSHVVTKSSGIGTLLPAIHYSNVLTAFLRLALRVAAATHAAQAIAHSNKRVKEKNSLHSLYFKRQVEQATSFTQ